MRAFFAHAWRRWTALLLFRLLASPFSSYVRHRVLAIQKLRTSVHEAGHAIALWHDPFVIRVKGARLDAGGGVVPSSMLSRTNDVLHAWNAAVNNLSGIAAEVVVLGAFRSGPSSSDIIGAKACAETIVACGGIPCPWSTLDDTSIDFARMWTETPEDDVVRVVTDCFRRAKSLVRGHRRAVLRIAALLYARRSLEEKDLRGILGPRPWTLVEHGSAFLGALRDGTSAPEDAS